MGGRIIYTPPMSQGHDLTGCEGKPDVAAYPPGTIWMCDDCQREWVLVDNIPTVEGGREWKPYVGV